ncbi:hypothetical protein CHH28_19510 [Bacterioplanes sanyensis]|uniref:Uncharacterized protein n=1 Tax=Bacterioplanes sanyensis TaxID=1249553 RepID=A0A222FPT2_9GAMM|nr:hypothetical protein [Bacterioplanes sanyensis]ASP40722.1 hypothetical protein CHH28_19510 [Bacterioplanes sanyensis]
MLRYGALLFALPGILLLSLYGLEMSAINDCKELGLQLDLASGQCSEQVQQHSSYYQRHATFVNLMMLVSIVGALMMTWGMMVRGMTRPN